MQTAVAKASGRGETWIQRRHLFPDPSASAETGPPTLQDATHTFKRGYILGRLRANAWNIAGTARDPDVARGYLYTLMQVLGSPTGVTVLRSGHRSGPCSPAMTPC